MKTNNFGRFLHSKVGNRFYNTLIGHVLFRDNPKVIPCCYYFLTEVLKYNDADNNQYSEIHHEIIDDLFKNYSRIGYRQYIDALIELKLLLVNDSYCPSEVAVKGIGHCKGYRVTDYAVELLNDSVKEYYYNLHTNKQIKRNIQKSISARKVYKKKYDDYVLDYIYDGLVNTSFNHEQATQLMDSLELTKRTRIITTNNLIRFTTKQIDELSYNDADGRLWNMYAALKSEMRQCSTYKNLSRQYTIDIRACHPTFFSSYILSLLTITPYCLPGSGQSIPDVYNKCLSEHKQWIALFCDTSTDARDIIAKNTCIKRDKVKDMLNKALNGYKRCKTILKWMETRFPYLYAVWDATDKTKTGITISKMFESAITLNQDLYRYADTLGDIKLMYEYDGYSVYGLPTDKQIKTKCQSIANEMQRISIALFNVPIVVKVKSCSIDVLKHPFMECDGELITIGKHLQDIKANTPEYISMNKELDAIEKSRKRMARDIWRHGTYSKDAHNRWKECKSECDELLQRMYNYMNN
jgi:hypothetical protein